MWVAGVDGCPAGWIAAFARVDADEAPRVRVRNSFAAVLDGPESLAVAVEASAPWALRRAISSMRRRGLWSPSRSLKD